LNSEITIPVIDIASLRKVEVSITPLSDNLYRVTLETKTWKLTFPQLGELGELIKEPKKLTEYKRRMMKCNGIKKGKKCGFYRFCESPSKSKKWVCMQDKFSRLTGCAFFHIYINEKEKHEEIGK